MKMPIHENLQKINFPNEISRQKNIEDTDLRGIASAIPKTNLQNEENEKSTSKSNVPEIGINSKAFRFCIIFK